MNPVFLLRSRRELGRRKASQRELGTRCWWLAKKSSPQRKKVMSIYLFSLPYVRTVKLLEARCKTDRLSCLSDCSFLSTSEKYVRVFSEWVFPPLARHFKFDRISFFGFSSAVKQNMAHDNACTHQQLVPLLYHTYP